MAYRVTCGGGRENTTTLAVCNAAGKWSFCNLYWQKLESQREEEREGFTWNVVLGIYAHLTHVAISVIEKAIEEYIIFVKLPLHVTDKLQPLQKHLLPIIVVTMVWNKTWSFSLPTPSWKSMGPNMAPTIVAIVATKPKPEFRKTYSGKNERTD